MSTTSTLMTAEQLLERAGQGRSELIRGELVELMPVGQLHGKLVARLLFWLMTFLEEFPLGSVSTEVGVLLARDPDLVYAPDILFVAKERDHNPDSPRFFAGAPDLAVEVLSPEDRAGKVQEKIRDYLSFGTRLVWVVDPASRTVTAYRPSGAAHVYSGSDEVAAPDILPGFSFTPEKLFPRP
jgi:Uma2 family endonuclease